MTPEERGFKSALAAGENEPSLPPERKWARTPELCFPIS